MKKKRYNDIEKTEPLVSYSVRLSKRHLRIVKEARYSVPKLFRICLKDLADEIEKGSRE